MKIREADGHDIPEIVEMYLELLKIAYPDRELRPIENMFRTVSEWFLQNSFVVVTYNDEEITGFEILRFHSAGGLTETVLDAEVAYVKPQYQNTRAAYLLFNTCFQYAKENKMALTATCNNQSGPIVQKRYGAVKTFECYEVSKAKIMNK